MDYKIFKFINELGGGPFWDYLSVFFATYLIYFLVIGVVTALWLAKPEGFTSKKFTSLFLAFGGAYFFNQLIGALYFRPRPFLAHDVHQLVYPFSAKSFPSDHAATSFALAYSVYLVDKRWGRVLLLLASVISVGRVMVGVHYPSDILVGALLGLLFGWLGKKLYDYDRVTAK